MPVFYFYMTHRLSSQPCAQIVEAWGGNGLTSWQKPARPTLRISLNTTYFVCYMYVLSVMGNRLTSKVHKGMFCWSMETFSQPWGVCHAVAWKAAESFTLQLPAPFKDFFFLLEWCSYVYFWVWNSSRTELGRKKYPLSKSDGGRWMELSEGSEWWKKTCPHPSSPSPSHSCCPAILLMASAGWM